MKINLFKKAVCLLCIITSFKTVAQSNTKEVILDPVSGEKINKTESFDFMYANKQYYFNTYENRASFKMNPQKFLLGQCAPEMITIDPVCGMKVNKELSYDFKYKEQKYFFDSYECRATFKTNPEKFIKNKCVAPEPAK